jgi:hypothetical protein
VNPPHVLRRVLHARHRRGVPLVLDDHGFGAGVLEDPRDLLGGRGLVDRTVTAPAATIA